MYKINVTIEGTRPLLQNRFSGGDEEGQTAKRKTVFNSEDEAKKRLYQDEKGIIYQPGEQIEGALIKAATEFKWKGRKSFKDIVKSGIFVEPEIIPHKYPEWEIDLRPVTIQRSRIMRARPRFNKWALDFSIIVTHDALPKAVLKELLDHAGRYMGIGDYRPKFGTFIVTKFEEE